jgi:hypothetical protein
LRVDAAGALDYEARPQFELTIRYRLQRADDAAWSSFVADLLESGVDPTTASGLFMRHETCRIRIDVADVDEPPVLRPQSLTIVVDGDQPAGEPARVAAEAGDAGDELKFEILSGVPDGVLAIDASSGLLSVTLPEALPVGSSVFPLTIRVTDAAGQSDVTTANVTVVRRAPGTLAASKHADPDGPALLVDPAAAPAADEPIVVPICEETAAVPAVVQNPDSEQAPVVESESPLVVRSTAGGLLRSGLGSRMNWPMLLIAMAAGLIGGAIVWRLRQQARGARLDELEHVSNATTEGAAAQRAINAADVWAEARPIRISATEESWGTSTPADVEVPADLWKRVAAPVSGGAAPPEWADAPTHAAEPISVPCEPNGADAPGAEVHIVAGAGEDTSSSHGDAPDAAEYGAPAWQPEPAAADLQVISEAAPADAGEESVAGERIGEVTTQWAQAWDDSTATPADAMAMAAELQPTDGDDPAAQPEVSPDVVESVNAILDEAGAVEAAARVEDLPPVTTDATPDSVPVAAALEHDLAASAAMGADAPEADGSAKQEPSEENAHATAGEEPATDDPRVSELRQRLSSLFGIPVSDRAAHETPAGHEPATIESPPPGASTIHEPEPLPAEDATLARLAELRSIVARATTPAGAETPPALTDRPAASRSEAAPQAATLTPGGGDVTASAPAGAPSVSAAAAMAAGRSSAGLDKTAMRLELSSLREVANRHARAAVAQHASRQQAQRQWIAAMAAMIVLCLLGTWMLNGGFAGVLRNAGWGLIAAGAGALVICVRAYWKLRAEGDDDFEFDAAQQMDATEREPVTRIVEDTRSGSDAAQPPAGYPLLHDELIELTQHFARSHAVEEESVVEAGR